MEEIKLRFNTITNKVEPNTYILMDKAGNRIGEINNITEVHLANSMNDANEITFSVYKKLGNKECVYWDSIKDFMLVWVKEWNQIYEIKVKLNDNQDMKSVSLTSLGRAELSQITTSLSVNTEDDIARDDYSPTLIWSDENKDISLLDIVLENAPHYQIIHVDKTIQNLQRTFEFENEFITDAFDEIAKEIDCVFFYSCYFSDGKIKREIYVYDLESNCNNPDCSYLSDKDLNAQGIAYRGQFTGVCPICGSTNISEGYGVDTTICVSKDDLGDEIELEVDTDSVKNCFKLVAGDDVMTSTIKKCNPNGSQYIWDINDETKSRMSDGLRDKLTEYDTLYQNYMTNSITQLETCLQRGFFENRLSDKSITPQEQKEIKQFMENQLATEFNKVNNMAIKINVEGYLFKPYHTDWVSAYNVLASETTRLILKDSTATVTISDDDYNTYMGYIDDYIIKFNTLISIFVAVYNTIIQNYSDYDIYEYKCDHCGYTSTTLTDGKCINCGNSSITKTRRCLKYKIEKPATNYPNLVTQYYNSIDLESLLTDVLMPNAENNENTSAEREIQNLENNLLTIGIDTLKLSNLQLLSANNAVLNMARILISNMYKVEIIQDDNYPSLEVYESYAIWKGTLCVTNYSDENDTCTMSAPTVITIRANDEQSIKERIDYVIKKQKTDKSMDVSNLFTVYEVDNDDSSKNTFKDKTEFFEYFDSELKKYSFNCLVTLKECAQSCVDILTEMQQQQSNIKIVKDSIDKFNEYYTPMLSHIQAEMDKRGKDIVSVQTMQSILETKINEINNKLNMQNFLTESQWIELCSYRREDVYENSNYISDGLGNSEIVTNARDFIRKAKEDIYKSSHMQYKISSTLKNFLVIPKFKPLADCFQVGNWIRFKVDGKIYKLRLLSYELDFDNLENMEVTFSDVVNIKDGISDIKSVLDQASSMASSYDSVQKQVSLNKDVNTVVNRWVDNGFDATLTKIVNTADHQNLVFDEHGLLGRQYDVYTDDYADEQFKLINNGLYITKDNWKTLETALGKIIYQDPLTSEYVTDYGLMANVIIGKLIAGNRLVIADDNEVITIDKDGVTLSGGKIKWKTKIDGSNVDGSTLLELNEFKEKVNIALTGDATEIGDDYIISPKIGGGYLYITDKDGNYSVEIDPTKKCDSSTDKYLICVKDRVNNKVIMGVNTSGNGEFSGKVSATQLDLCKDGIKYGQFDIGKMGYPIFGTEEVKGIGLVAENTDGYGRNILFCTREKVEKTNDDGTIYYEEEVVPRAGITPTSVEELMIDAQSLHVFHSWVMSHFHSGMLIDGELRVGGNRTVRSFADANNDLHNVFIWWDGRYLESQVDSTRLGTLFTCGNDNASSCKLIEGSNNMKLKFVSFEDGSSYALACTQWIKDNFQSSSSSDYRLKENISSIKNIKDIYLNLKPKQYRFKENCDDNAEKLHFGLIAQEVVSLFEQNGFDTDNLDLIERYNTRPYTDEGAYIRDGKAYRINYENLHAYHIRFGQEIYAELTDRCDKLEEENKELKTENEELKNKIDDLEERLTKLEKLFFASNN